MKIVIADDHSIVRRGLQQIIALRSGWTVVAEVPAADDVLPALRRQHADVLVLDVSLGGRSGIDLLAQIGAEFPSLPVLMLSMHHEELYAIRCLRAGASGYIEKGSTPDELIAAIERVAKGHTYVSDAVADQLAAEVVRGPAGLPHERLTTREFEVLRLMAGGQTVTGIAAALHLSVKTISTYRSRILEKTGFRTTAEIVAYAIRTGLV
jgi:two-component system invasion response regulator UvrY